jgi:DNA-directed RNA polymerase specialized sigma24 family protein
MRTGGGPAHGGSRGMSHVEGLERLSVAAVCDRCREETTRFRRREAHDDRYCFDVIRRAVVEGEQRCWEAITEIYHDHVIGWCRRSGAAEEDLDGLALEAWERFWQSYTAEKLADAGGSTAAVLAYLKLCARSVVLDEARRRGRTARYEPAGQDTIGAPAEAAASRVEHADLEAFWRLIDRHLRGDRERLLVHLAYELDLPAAAIQRRHPDLFPAVTDVYKVHRNILDRLRRSKELPGWLGLGRD